jgi:SAM-dependent methyltransferase
MTNGLEPPRACRVCGAAEIRFNAILWDALIAQWQLAPAEVAYLDRQQGLHCAACGAVLRSMVLAEAIGRCVGHDAPLQRIAENERARQTRVLQVNQILGVDAALATLPRLRKASYPAFDIMALDLPDGAFDLVVHSDTLEHIAEPRRALAECRRVLATGGYCCFTVPIVVGRLSRSRGGLPKSYHGGPGIELEDFVVHSEFGADIWTYVFDVGFRTCELVALEYPAGIAIRAQR